MPRRYFGASSPLNYVSFSQGGFHMIVFISVSKKKINEKTIYTSFQLPPLSYHMITYMTVIITYRFS